MDQPTLVLGLGNPLMGDDGAGLAALEALRRGYAFGPGVELEDGGGLGLGLLPLVEDAAALLVLDAVRFGGRPGTTVVREGDEIPRCLSLKLSPHQAGFRETLALAGLRGNLPRRLALVGVEVAGAEYAEPLSPEVKSALPAMVAAAVARLESWGCSVRPIASAERGDERDQQTIPYQYQFPVGGGITPALRRGTETVTTKDLNKEIKSKAKYL